MTEHTCECWYCKPEIFGEHFQEIPFEQMVSEAKTGHFRAQWFPRIDGIWVDGVSLNGVYECQAGDDPWIIRFVEPHHWHECGDHLHSICLEKISVSSVRVRFADEHWDVMKRILPQEDLEAIDQYQSTR
ncbi:MAG TPA: hypothetical protein VH593_06745 [Ktedonobacteraceae bacterium]|jgi:hypothetical protein